MRFRSILIYVGSFLCLINGALLVANDFEGVGFGGPHVLKLDWATRGLRTTDFNGDGRIDLAVINNDSSHIDILLQNEAGQHSPVTETVLDQDRWKPVFEDAHYMKESVSIGFPVFDLIACDLNGDGLGDVAYTARESPLSIRFQGADTDFSELIEFEGFDALGWVETLSASDLEGDGRIDLVVLSADGFRVLRRTDQGFGEPILYRLTGLNPFNLMVRDLTGDGLQDILYVSTNGKQYLVLREQLTDGGFGPERRFVLKGPVRSIRIVENAESENVTFCGVNSRTGGLDFFALQPRDLTPIAIEDTVYLGQPQVYSLFDQGRGAASYASGDMNVDGIEDLFVSNPKSAEVLIFLGRDSGFDSPVSYPSFVDVSSIVTGRFFSDRAIRLVTVSAEEQLVGLSACESSGRLGFPRSILDGVGAPLACCVQDINEDGFDELLLIVEEKGDFSIVVCEPTDREAVDSAWSIVSTFALQGVKRKPSQIRAIDVFDGTGAGFVVFVPREAPLFLKVEEADSFVFEELSANSSLRSGLLKGVASSELSIFDINNDGKNELMVSRKGFARVLRFREGELELLDQLNMRSEGDTVEAVIPFVGNADGGWAFAYISSANEFQVFEKDSTGVFRYRKSEEVGSITLVDWFTMNGPSGESRLILGGQNRFWTLPKNSASWELVPLSSYETKLENVFFSQVAVADFNSDGKSEIVAVDGSHHVTEILSYQNSLWANLMHWEVFKQNMHYQGRTGGNFEPREIVIGNFTTDALPDFGFLVHDRVLFYPQE